MRWTRGRSRAPPSQARRCLEDRLGALGPADAVAWRSPSRWPRRGARLAIRWSSTSPSRHRSLPRWATRPRRRPSRPVAPARDDRLRIDRPRPVRARAPLRGRSPTALVKLTVLKTSVHVPSSVTKALETSAPAAAKGTASLESGVASAACVHVTPSVEVRCGNCTVPGPRGECVGEHVERAGFVDKHRPGVDVALVRVAGKRRG